MTMLVVFFILCFLGGGKVSGGLFKILVGDSFRELLLNTIVLDNSYSSKKST